MADIRARARLQEHSINALPPLFNWSELYPNTREDGAILLLRASTHPQHGTKPHQRLKPAATIVEIPLGPVELVSLAATLQEAIRILRVKPDGSRDE